MTDKILLKRSLVSGSIPTTASLDAGELAVNVHDAAVYLKQSGSDQEVIRSLLTLDVPVDGNIFLSGSIFVSEEIFGRIEGTSSLAENALLLNNTSSATFATTGSNIFDGTQVIIDETNSTSSDTGALIIAGGVGIDKDVNIGGDLNVFGIITATTFSIEYITSSQLVIGTSRVIVNHDDLIRFAGLSVVDSGSTPASASLLWDSLKNHFIVETDTFHNGDEFVDVASAILITGPETYDNLGNEIGLIPYRVPVATSDHNISTEMDITPLRVISGSRELHVETDLYVTGSVTATEFTGSFSGSLSGISEQAVTASYSENSGLLNNTGSATFATTGSNIFIGDQIVTGSIFSDSDTIELTGSLEVFGTASITGDLSIAEGVLILNPIETPLSGPLPGGIFFSSSGDFFVGIGL